MFLSNPSIEVWLLAHFERTGKWFETGARVEDQLNQHWSREFESEYAKGDVRNFARLQSRLPAVTENAKSVREHQHTGVAMKDANSATEMYILVENLLREPVKDGEKPAWKSPSVG